MDGAEWLEAHRDEIDSVVTSEAEASMLAHRIIPEVAVDPASRTVAADRFDYLVGAVADGDDPLQIPRADRAVRIPKLQIDDADASRALTAVRRAAQELARDHDESVFRVALADRIEAQAAAEDPEFQDVIDILPVGESIGEGVVATVAAAIGRLDDEGYRNGYVLVVSDALWIDLHRRGQGLTSLPIDAVRSVIDDGPVYRSSVLQGGDALVLSLGEGRIDQVVAEKPTVAFVDQNANVRSYDVFERFVTRFRETRSAVMLRLVQDAVAQHAENPAP